MIAHGFKHVPSLKICARPGCETSVKKATAKYCSISCCAMDPVRQERLRRQARRAPIVPLAHQLSIMFQVHPDMEASLDERVAQEIVSPGDDLEPGPGVVMLGDHPDVIEADPRVLEDRSCAIRRRM